METLLLVSTIISGTSLLAWVWMVVARGQFWRTDHRLPPGRTDSPQTSHWPAVEVVIPARDEADVLPFTLPRLLSQDYPGPFHITLVDDRSEDGTAQVARKAASDMGAEERLTVITAEPLPTGWAGKVWALHQGIAASRREASEYILLADADIAHTPDSLRALVFRAVRHQLDLVSVMSRLRVETTWDRLLIPAFVFFFAKLYPFRWVSDPRKSTAAAAGGCVLLRRDALERAGGLEPIAGELIDDCALARRIKRYGGEAGGMRRYRTLAPIWNMVARTAFCQLRFSSILLIGTVYGMLALYLVPLMGALGGLVALTVSMEGMSIGLAATGIAAWTLMAASYLPMLRWHNTSPMFAPLLPLTALLYTLMTVDSAVRWWRGKGGSWKGRTYPQPPPTRTRGG